MWKFEDSKSTKKAVTRSISKGATIVRRAYVKAAPNGPPKDSKNYPNHKKMRKSARRKIRRPQKRKNAVAKVGYNVGIKGRSDPRRAYHAHLPSVGTVQRTRWRTSGMPTGRVRRNHRISREVSTAYIPAIRAIEAEYRKYTMKMFSSMGK